MLKQVTSKVKCRSGGNSALWLATQEEKVVHESSAKFAIAKSNAVAGLLRWSKGEENELFAHIFGRVAELNWLWKESMDEFNNQYLHYRKHFKTLFQRGKDVDEQKKRLMVLHTKVAKATKQLEVISKKNDASRIQMHINELETLSAEYDELQNNMLATVQKLELEKVAYVRAALEEQANAFVGFAEKCRTIYSAQRALVELIPQNADIAFLSEGHSTLVKNIYTIVASVGEKLGMSPPPDGGIDSVESLQLFVSPVTDQYRNRCESLDEVSALKRKPTQFLVPSNPDKIAKVARKGNIGPPIPPRSQESLLQKDQESVDSVYDEDDDEIIYVTPNVTSGWAKKKPLEDQPSDASSQYAVITYNEGVPGLTRSYSDSEVLYRDTTDKAKSARNSVKTKPPRPPQPRKASLTSHYSSPLFRELTPSPSPTPPPEDNDPPYQTPIDALSPKPRSRSDIAPPSYRLHEREGEQEIRAASECPRRLVRVRGSSRRKHQPIKRVSEVEPPPMLKALSLDSLNMDEDDYEEIYTNPYDSLNIADNKPLHVGARLSVSSAGIPGYRKQTVRHSTSPVGGGSSSSNSSIGPPLPPTRMLSRSADNLDQIDHENSESSLLQRRRLRNRHASMDDSVKRLRHQKQLKSQKQSFEVQTYPESPQHLRGVGSQENLFFAESMPLSAISIKEEYFCTSSPASHKKLMNVNGVQKDKRNNKKLQKSSSSRMGLFFRKKSKDSSNT